MESEGARGNATPLPYELLHRSYHVAVYKHQGEQKGTTVDEVWGYVVPHAAHHSYLLRLWQSENGGWRASLQSIQTSERHMFADLESLLAFLADHSWPPATLARQDRPAESNAD